MNIQPEPQNTNQISSQPEPPKQTLQQSISVDNKNQVSQPLYKQAAHPCICLLTIVFKITALIVFIIISFIVEKQSLLYLIIIILGIMDFWIVKNLSGRKLVGLRWWNEVKNNGEEVWIFESKNEKEESSVDKSVFWISLYVNAGGWLIFTIYELIKLSITWFSVCMIMLVFGGINLYGFFKCSRDQQKKIKSFGGKMVVNAAKQTAIKGMEAATN